MKPIYNITKFSMLDYPNELACIVWFIGCNMKCKYCHNPQIATAKGEYSLDDVKDFLNSRQGVLTGVVLSGGEATLHKDLPKFAKELKDMGFRVKLDTNGTNPEMLEQLIEENLVDYVALDYKSTKKKFKDITQCDKWKKFDQSLDLLIEKQDKIRFEVRTTWHTSLLEEDDIEEILQDLNSRGYKQTFYLQKCNPVDNRASFAHLPMSRPLNTHRFFGRHVDVKIR